MNRDARSTVDVAAYRFSRRRCTFGSGRHSGEQRQPQIGLFTGLTAATADAQPVLNRSDGSRPNGWRSTLDCD